MIARLSIQGLAIIDSLEIEFAPGFNVITGETGAGKSILIRGLNFLLGAKASSEAVRQGYEQAVVSGEFLVPQGHPALSVLERLGIEVDYGDAGGGILIRRQITSKGRSQSWVNDVPVTGQGLRELGRELVDVFAQHENQRLMDPLQHTTYLDRFIGDSGVLRARVTELVRHSGAVLSEIEEGLQAFQRRDRDKDYLAFRREALAKFKPSVQDYENVEALCREADRSSKWRDLLSRIVSCLDGDEGHGPAKAMWEAARLLGGIAASGERGDSAETDAFAALQARVENVAREIDDLSYEVGRLAAGAEIDEGELEAAQSRLFGYQDLFRKHGVRDIEALVGESERLTAELEGLERAAERLSEKLSELGELARRLTEAADELTTARKHAAVTIRQKVEREMHELAMPGAALDVRFHAADRQLPAIDLSTVAPALQSAWESVAGPLTRVGEGGAERGEFLLASNRGEAFLPLVKIASGGEMSRILLALKKALIADAETCVLVFDEIDTGVSGRVADVVGRKMGELAAGFQVICISHLPQVAVYADTHFLVRKGAKGERTESTIVRLTAEESACEIARLLSGAEVTPTSLAHARSLIEKAKGSRPEPASLAAGLAPTAKRPKRRGKTVESVSPLEA